MFWRSYIFHTYISISLIITVGFTYTAFAYHTIYRVLKSASATVADMRSSASQQRNHDRERKITNLMLLTTVTYICWWSPAGFTFCAGLFGFGLRQEVDITLSLGGYSLCVIDPLLFIYYSKSTQEEIKKLFSCIFNTDSSIGSGDDNTTINTGTTLPRRASSHIYYIQELNIGSTQLIQVQANNPHNLQNSDESS